MFKLKIFFWLCSGIMLILSVISQNVQEVKPKPPIVTGMNITIDAAISHKNQTAFYNEVILQSNSINYLTIKNLQSSNIGFAVIQVHSYLWNVTLSYNETIETHYYENGTNLGLTLYPDTEIVTVFLHNQNYYTNVSAIIALVIYNKTAPVPGGCNLEYSVADAPVLIVKSEPEFITVDTPLAGSYINDHNNMTCNASEFQYIGYHYYLKAHDFSLRTYFDGIRAMLNVKHSIKNGQVALSWPNISNRRSYIAIPGTGVVFGTIIRNDHGIAAYVPAYTISCKPLYWENDCKMYNSPGYHVLIILLIFIGTIKTYFSHVFQGFATFVDGFIIGAYLIFYILYYSEKAEEMSQGLLLFCIITTGLILAATFTICGSKVRIIRPFLATADNIIVGYLNSSLVLFVIDDIRYTATDYFQELIMIGSICLTVICFPSCYIIWRIVLSAYWGAAAIMQGIFFITGSPLAMILINPLRNLSIKNYQFVNSTPKLYAGDFWYLIVWLLLITTGIRFKNFSRKVSSEMFPGENEPLISRWTHGSDSVFETPRSNQRFISRYRRQRR